MRREMEQMSIQIGLLQRAVSNGPAVAHDAGARLRIPEPKAYNGARDAKEVENFLFDIEQYFLAAKRGGRGEEAIREQFFPENVEYNARRALRKLEHSGSVRDYVKSFSALMLDIRDMSEKDKLFTFMEGLKPWARLELQRQRTTSSPAQNKTGGAKSFRSNSNRGGGDRNPTLRLVHRNKPQENRQGAPQKSSGCFLCDGPHRYRDCPKKQLLNALATFTDKASPRSRWSHKHLRVAGMIRREDEDNLGAISQWCNTLSHQVAAKKTVPPRAGVRAHSWRREEVVERIRGRDAGRAASEASAKRTVDHEIELVPGTKPPARAPYRMSQPELVELRKQLKEMLESGIIKPAKSPYGAPVLFQKKADGSLRMCCDYRALNKITVKNKYPIPLVADCFDRLSRAKYFTKIDLRSGYWQVRIKEGDEAKTTVVTRYGAFEFLVMPFGLTNAPATFSTLMNQVLHGFLDEFVVVYLGYCCLQRNLGRARKHLRQVLTRLREHELYAKVSKCSFAQETISFLGHLWREDVFGWTQESAGY
ncbi:UNVERIFIED_CONTAM: RNA-directed DNA polymerase [Sesamum latifolium]|uniref:RNA-directed DNA polymerase n=1 Tax=Sesamum latifolium TaxID=2727402 RepID=A0AAW2XUH7_9LAMI